MNKQCDSSSNECSTSQDSDSSSSSSSSCKQRRKVPGLQDSDSSSSSSSSCKQRRKVPGLQRDVKVLKSELLNFIAEHGQEGFMPMRKQLREHRRVDIEKAITRLGGFRRTAVMMNISLAYKQSKPKGYWDNFENLQEEISWFQRNWGMDPLFMPSRKTFERADKHNKCFSI